MIGRGELEPSRLAAPVRVERTVGGAVWLGLEFDYRFVLRFLSDAREEAVTGSTPHAPPGHDPVRRGPGEIRVQQARQSSETPRGGDVTGGIYGADLRVSTRCDLAQFV